MYSPVLAATMLIQYNAAAFQAEYSNRFLEF